MRTSISATGAAYDGEWQLRRDFLRQRQPFLKSGGVIVVCENNRASTVDDDFRRMIEDGGLTIVATHNNVPGRTQEDRFYFMISCARAIRRRPGPRARSPWSAHSRASGNPEQQAPEFATLGPRFRGNERS